MCTYPGWAWCDFSSFLSSSFLAALVACLVAVTKYLTEAEKQLKGGKVCFDIFFWAGRYSPSCQGIHCIRGLEVATAVSQEEEIN